LASASEEEDEEEEERCRHRSNESLPLVSFSCFFFLLEEKRASANEQYALRKGRE